MPLLIGYTLISFTVIFLILEAISALHRTSKFKRSQSPLRNPPLLRPRTIISFSIILPFATLAFLLLTFAGMKAAQEMIHNGHISYVIGSLTIPTACFLLGYVYFKDMVTK